jgi:hypothetical protein
VGCKCLEIFWPEFPKTTHPVTLSLSFTMSLYLVFRRVAGSYMWNPRSLGLVFKTLVSILHHFISATWASVVLGIHRVSRNQSPCGNRKTAFDCPMLGHQVWRVYCSQPRSMLWEHHKKPCSFTQKPLWFAVCGWLQSLPACRVSFPDTLLGLCLLQAWCLKGTPSSRLAW